MLPYACAGLQGATGHQDVRVRLEQQGDAAAGVLGMQGSRGHTDTIDILSVSPDWVWSSDDEDQPGEQLNYLPVVSLVCARAHSIVDVLLVWASWYRGDTLPVEHW